MNDLLERPIPGTIIGYLDSGEPVIVCAGSSDDDDSDDVGIDLDGGGDTDADDEQDDVDEDSDDDADKPKPAAKKTDGNITQADIDALREAQAKRNAEHRSEVRKLRAQLREIKTAGQKADAGTDEAAVKAIEEAQAAAEKRYKPIAIRSAARAAFLEAGLTDLSDSRMKSLTRLLVMEDIEVDEDGDVVGLDDQIDAIKEDLPELFRKPETESVDNGKPRIRAPKGDAADKKNAPQKPKTTGELYAQRIGVA
jgi:hypothetical protein